MATHAYQSHHPLPPPPPPHHQDGNYPQSQPYQYQAQNQQPANYQHQPQPQQFPALPQQQAQQYQYQQQQHQLPPPPPSHQQQHQQQHQHQPRQRASSRNRSFSLRSDKSHGSGKGEHLQETAAEKEAKRLHTKADPSMAMNEMEPAAVAAMAGESTHAPLRSMRHKDQLGNMIADPDKSNPTRSRWERPLDTIRSFEAAIDGENNRKSMVVRTETDYQAAWNRRSSYFPPSSRGRQSAYFDRPVSFRPESTQFELSPPMPRNSYYNGGEPSPGPYGPGPSRQRPPRFQSEPVVPGYGRDQTVYPLQHKDRSYETVTSAAGSGSSADQAGYQTDPTSSDNSSIDRISPGKKPMPVNDYGIGFSQSPTYKNAAFTLSGPAQNGPPAAPPHGGPPPVPRKDPGPASVLRRQPSAAPTAEPKKKDSWLKRRFSKQG